jgi:glycosyltransferase involved in cell wall biosynthesis
MNAQAARPGERTVSVVIPVYRGSETLRPLVAEIEPLTKSQMTPGGRGFRVAEVVLVWDRGPDASDDAIRDLSQVHPWVRPVWLSRNYGQHAATLAGMASAGGDWVVTLDEDGQHDPAAIADLLDTALSDHAQVVYGVPGNPPPHGVFRNGASKIVKSVVMRLLVEDVPKGFSSYRIVLGEIARSMAAYAGPGVYLDVALGWVTARVSHCPITARTEGRPATSYTFRRLASHFWRLVISSGTRPLRLVSALGFITALFGALLSLFFIFQRLHSQVPIAGWTSVIVTVLFVGGATLFSLGVIAEYVGAALRSAMGRPLYVTVRDPQESFAGSQPDDEH